MLHESFPQMWWPEEVLSLPFAGQGVDDDGKLIWNGPRVKMGLYEVRIISKDGSCSGILQDLYIVRGEAPFLSFSLLA